MATKKYDDETLNAELIKFNAFLALEAKNEEAERAVKKAARRREEAAKTLKDLVDSPSASAEEKAEAEAAWKAAVDVEKRVTDGDLTALDPPKPAADPAGATSAAESDDAAEVDVTDPDAGDGDTTARETAESDTTESDTAESDTTGSDTTEGEGTDPAGVADGTDQGASEEPDQPESEPSAPDAAD